MNCWARRERFRRWAWRWGPLLVWMAGITFFSSRPRPLGPLSEGPWGAPIGRTAHALEYAGLAALFYRALRDRQGRWSRWALAWAAAVAFGLADEFHQSFVPGRDCSAADLLIDAGGAAAALAVIELWAARGERVLPRLLEFFV